MESAHPKQACTLRRYEVSSEELPVSCPLPEMALWNAHPKVYLAFDSQARAQCPYCGAEFVLTDKP